MMTIPKMYKTFPNLPELLKIIRLFFKENKMFQQFVKIYEENCPRNQSGLSPN